MLRTNRGWRPSAAALLLTTAVLSAAAADKPCSSAELEAAGKAADRVTSWAALQKSVTDFAHCDKATAAEYFTEALLRVLIGGWSRVEEAGPILERDAAFRGWLMKRLRGSDIPKEDAASIANLAKKSCPKGHEKVCADIAAEVDLGQAFSSPELLLLPGIPTQAPPAKAKP